MIGFQITINDTTEIKIGSHSSNVLLMNINDNYILLQYGDDDKNLLQWAKYELKKGDKINIKVKNLNSISLPYKIEPKNIFNIREDYLNLKTELEKKGLL